MADRKAMSSVEHRAGRSLNRSWCQLARHGVLRVLALLARKATVEIGWPHNGHCQAKALGRQNPTPLLNELLVGSAHWSDVAVQVVQSQWINAPIFLTKCGVPVDLVS